MPSIILNPPLVNPADQPAAATPAAVFTEADFRRLYLQGFRDGAPAHITASTQQADALLCRTMKCPGCRQRGMCYAPFHRPHKNNPGRPGQQRDFVSNSYRALAVCQRPDCGACEEI